MKKDNFSYKLDNFLESKTFYIICLSIVLFVLASIVSDCLVYLDNH